jgi:hypothetical protein
MAPTTPPLAKEQKMKAASFYKYILGRTCILANLVLVLVGLGQLQVPFFFQNFTRTIQLPTKWPELPHHWPKNRKQRQPPSEVYLRKILYTRQLGVGFWLGWGSFRFRYFSRTSLELYNCLQNGPNYPTIGQRTENEGRILLKIYLRKNIYTCQLGVGLGWVGAASGSVIFPELR